MTSSTTRRLSALAAASLFSAAVAIPAFAAGPVSVTVNGNAANLNPPPTERAGRVFVPLRGVFEQLGASVVYQSGVINATGRGHNISLKIGSQQATVDGQQQNVDVAPFIIGASTYVPLRFVSQALGATVNYDGSNRVVAINTNGSGNTTAQNPPPQAPPNNNNNNGNNSPVTLTNQLPVPNATIKANRTTAQATFDGGTVNPNTIHVLFDSRDVTARAYVSDQGITYTTPVLPAIKHTVRVTGKDSAGAAFDRRWSFTSGGGADTTNSITGVLPSANSTVPNQFTIRRAHGARCQRDDPSRRRAAAGGQHRPSDRRDPRRRRRRELAGRADDDPGRRVRELLAARQCERAQRLDARRDHHLGRSELRRSGDSGQVQPPGPIAPVSAAAAGRRR